jgi:hypothetical protein
MEYMESMMQNQYDAQNQLIMELDETRMERDQLKAERDALSAQNKELLCYVVDAEAWFNKHDPNGYVSPKRKQAQQHLAEICAEAGRKGFLQGQLYVLGDPDEIDKEYAELRARQYAASVRQGAE